MAQSSARSARSGPVPPIGGYRLVVLALVGLITMGSQLQVAHGLYFPEDFSTTSAVDGDLAHDESISSSSGSTPLPATSGTNRPRQLDPLEQLTSYAPDNMVEVGPSSGSRERSMQLAPDESNEIAGRAYGSFEAEEKRRPVRAAPSQKNKFAYMRGSMRRQRGRSMRLNPFASRRLASAGSASSGARSLGGPVGGGQRGRHAHKRIISPVDSWRQGSSKRHRRSSPLASVAQETQRRPPESMGQTTECTCSDNSKQRHEQPHEAKKQPIAHGGGGGDPVQAGLQQRASANEAQQVHKVKQGGFSVGLGPLEFQVKAKHEELESQHTNQQLDKLQLAGVKAPTGAPHLDEQVRQATGMIKDLAQAAAGKPKQVTDEIIGKHVEPAKHDGGHHEHERNQKPTAAARIRHDGDGKSEQRQQQPELLQPLISLAESLAPELDPDEGAAAAAKTSERTESTGAIVQHVRGQKQAGAEVNPNRPKPEPISAASVSAGLARASPPTPAPSEQPKQLEAPPVDNVGDDAEQQATRSSPPSDSSPSATPSSAAADASTEPMSAAASEQRAPGAALAAADPSSGGFRASPADSQGQADARSPSTASDESEADAADAADANEIGGPPERQAMLPVARQRPAVQVSRSSGAANSNNSGRRESGAADSPASSGSGSAAVDLRGGGGESRQQQQPGEEEAHQLGGSESVGQIVEALERDSQADPAVIQSARGNQKELQAREPSDGRAQASAKPLGAAATNSAEQSAARQSDQQIANKQLQRQQQLPAISSNQSAKDDRVDNDAAATADGGEQQEKSARELQAEGKRLFDAKKKLRAGKLAQAKTDKLEAGANKLAGDKVELKQELAEKVGHKEPPPAHHAHVKVVKPTTTTTTTTTTSTTPKPYRHPTTSHEPLATKKKTHKKLHSQRPLIISQKPQASHHDSTPPSSGQQHHHAPTPHRQHYHEATTSSRPVDYTHGAPATSTTEPLYKSPRLAHLAPKCRHNFERLLAALNQLLALIEQLGQSVLLDERISYITRDVLSRRMARIRISGEEARLSGSLGRLRALNDGARAAGLELMRLANSQVAHELDAELRPFALKFRKIYGAYRKSCNTTSSKPPAASHSAHTEQQ